MSILRNCLRSSKNLPRPICICSRGRHSTHQHDGTVELAYTSVIPDNGNATEGPLVILHGLLGSKRNWGSFLKAFHQDMPDRPIYALDLRNHGESPIAGPVTYEIMAQDVLAFITKKRLEDVTLLGHSMGGKVAMAYALSSPKSLSKLIVADIAPSIGKLSDEFSTYLESMRHIESRPPGSIKTRADADKILAENEPDLAIRQFLMTNFRPPSAGRTAGFQVPVDLLHNSITELGQFPYEHNKEDGSVPVAWEGPTLAIKGAKSNYINSRNIAILRAFFPNVRLEELDSGHWVHAEKPTEFRRLVVDFMSTKANS